VSTEVLFCDYEHPNTHRRVVRIQELVKTVLVPTDQAQELIESVDINANLKQQSAFDFLYLK